MPRRTLAATTFALLLASTAPPPALATDAPLSRPISTIHSAPGEIWSALLSFISFLGHGMDPDGLKTPDSDLGHGMDPNG